MSGSMDQSVDVTLGKDTQLPLKKEVSVDIPVPLGMEDIVKAVGRLRPFERVQQRTAEQAVSLAPRERAQQRTFLQVEDVPRCLGEDVEAVRFAMYEQVKQRTVEQVVHEVPARDRRGGESGPS